MAFLADDDLATLRGLIGDSTPPTDSDLEDDYDRLGDIYLVAREVLQRRLATLLEAPAQFSVSGYSENNSANIAALRAELDRVDATVTRLGLATGSAVTSVNLTRLRPIR